MDRKKFESTVIQSFKQSLAYSSLEYQVILYSNCKGYEYNTTMRTLRPFNSILWFNMNSKYSMKNILDFIDSKCNDVIDDIEESGYSTDTSFIYFDEGRIIISLDDLGYFAHHNLSEEYMKSYIDFICFIEEIYSINDVLLQRVVDINQEYLK